MHDDQEDELFQREMQGVRPLPADDRVHLPGRARPSPAQLARRQAAQAAPTDSNPLSIPDEIPQVDPADIVGRKKNGVQEGVYRKLRLGKYEAQSRLDLHRMTLREARRQVYDFLEDCYGSGLRTVLITHGKGQHSPTPGRLKSYTLHWLDESERVLAWHSAPAQYGGAGATFVLLRKSADARQRTREFFSKGRTS
jgi:DNA-nicking Smr family endonuclease